MALIKCPECENEISDKAEACPKCGCPISKASDSISETSSSSYVYKRKIPIVPIVVIVIIVAILIGITIYTNTKKPAGMSDEMYSIGTSAIKVIDDYIDNNIDYETAYNKLDGLYEQAERQAEEESGYSSIKYDISLLRSELHFEHNGNSTYSELLEERNDLAEYLNVSKK